MFLTSDALHIFAEKNDNNNIIDKESKISTKSHLTEMTEMTEIDNDNINENENENEDAEKKGGVLWKFLFTELFTIESYPTYMQLFDKDKVIISFRDGRICVLLLQFKNNLLYNKKPSILFDFQSNHDFKFSVRTFFICPWISKGVDYLNFELITSNTGDILSHWRLQIENKKNMTPNTTNLTNLLGNKKKFSASTNSNLNLNLNSANLIINSKEHSTEYSKEYSAEKEHSLNVDALKALEASRDNNESLNLNLNFKVKVENLKVNQLYGITHFLGVRKS